MSDRLSEYPITVDGVTIKLGMRLWRPDSRPARVVGILDAGLAVEVESLGERSVWWCSRCYSTDTAAGWPDAATETMYHMGQEVERG